LASIADLQSKKKSAVNRKSKTTNSDYPDINSPERRKSLLVSSKSHTDLQHMNLSSGSKSTAQQNRVQNEMINPFLKNIPDTIL
jgi:hypothetical protein